MSVYQAKNGKWYCIFYLDEKGADGKWKQKKKSGFKYKREALAWEAEYKAAEKEKKKDMAPTMNFRMLVDAYINDLKLTRTRKGQTIWNNAKRLKGFIKKLPFADEPLENITPAIIRKQFHLEFLLRVDENGNRAIKDSTARIYNASMASVFDYAVRLGIVATNPVRQAGGLAKVDDTVIDDTDEGTSSHVDYWTVQEFNAFIGGLPDTPLADMHRIVFLLLFWSGCRRGEAMGLRRKDIDADLDLIRIRQNCVPDMNGVLHYTTTKTKKSRRDVYIPHGLSLMLKEWMEQMPTKNPDDVLFLASPISITNAFVKYQKEQSIQHRLKLHGLRHSHASLLISQHIPLFAIAERLGHTDLTQLSRTYGYLYEQEKRDVVSGIDRLFTITA